MTLFRPISERSNLEGGGRINAWCLLEVRPECQTGERGVGADYFLLIAPRGRAPRRGLGFSLVAVVGDHVLLGGAGDGVVVLEEADGAPGVHQQGVVRHRVAALHASVASVGDGQAVEDLRPPAGRSTGCRQTRLQTSHSSGRLRSQDYSNLDTI